MKRWVFLLFCVARAQAMEEPSPLTLNEVLEAVRARYPPMRAIELDRQAAEGELQSSRGAFDLGWRTRVATTPLGFYQNERLDTVIEKPTSVWGIGLFAGYRLGRGKFALYDGKLETNPLGELRAGADIPLWRNRAVDRRRAGIARAGFGLTAAEAQVRQTRLDSLRSASHRYWDWVAAGRKIEIARDLLKIAVDRDEAIRERVRHGDLPELERKDNERAILQRRGAYVAARRAFEQATIDLSLFLREGTSGPILSPLERVPATIPPPEPVDGFDLSRAIETANDRRPEISRLTALKEQASVDTELAENQVQPRLDLQLAVSQDLGRGDETRRPTEFEGGLVLEVPLERDFPLGRLGVARANLQRNEVQERFTRERIAAEVRDSHSAFVATMERWRLVQDELKLARELERGERVRFQQGDSNLLFVNLREQATADAAAREVDVLAECQRSFATLKFALGELD